MRCSSSATATSAAARWRRSTSRSAGRALRAQPRRRRLGGDLGHRRREGRGRTPSRSRARPGLDLTRHRSRGVTVSRHAHRPTSVIAMTSPSSRRWDGGFGSGRASVCCSVPSRTAPRPGAGARAGRIPSTATIEGFREAFAIIRACVDHLVLYPAARRVKTAAADRSHIRAVEAAWSRLVRTRGRRLARESSRRSATAGGGAVFRRRSSSKRWSCRGQAALGSSSGGPGPISGPRDRRGVCGRRFGTPRDDGHTRLRRARMHRRAYVGDGASRGRRTPASRASHQAFC